MKESGAFEKKLVRLEEIVEKLENEDLDIETTLELFQEGMKLGKESRKMLDEIELKVNKVLGTDEDGNVETEPAE
ncbi:exodeoxyribonuclease VII small subunit [Limisalsivibrio acetivorans]|uniref:exodeoxyribonuclease VII small subunit n=1 Tax=Limisalsivibrio acetivorans TaxID=1304888 RepID=UPI0003B4707A|nr:exodeoxyribonuclease VII small subunit [Limisalsivibrio acetivorans]